MEKLLKKITEQVAKQFNSVCPKCGAGFNCGMKSNKKTCWCFYEEPGRNIGTCPPGSCLCKKCMTEK
jgi:hypothetical protein